MTIKVQGETYESAEDVREAIESLTAQMEDMPESSGGREDLRLHIERLKTAVESPEQPPHSPGENAAVPAEEAPAILGAGASEPAEQEPEPEPIDDEEGFPPGFHRCPVCLGSGALRIEPPIDPRAEQCPRCSGYGQVLTGSMVEGHVSRDCPDCNGQGWIDKRATVAPSGNGDLAAPQPSWPGATWDEEQKAWNPPAGQKPWEDAVWDSLQGVYK